MILTLGKRSQPSVEIIVGEVVPIYELVDCSRIRTIAHQEVDVTRIGFDIGFTIYRDWTSFSIKYLNTCQAEVIAVTPGLQNIEFQASTSRKVGNYKR